MQSKTIKRNIAKEIVQEKCPSCGIGPTFEAKTKLLSIPKMRTHCSTCGFHFEKEPGYFIGAMYVSYGLAVLVGILSFLTTHFLFPQLSLELKTILTLSTILLFSKKNYKLSRLIYLRIA